MSQRNIIYTIRFTEKEWKRLEQKIRENDEWKFKYGTKEGRVNIAAYIRDPNSGHSMTAQEMETVVRRMNEQERSPEELLSDKILFYDYQERKLKLATEREKELVEENELQEDKISEKAENQPEKKEEKTMGIIPRF